MLIISKEKDITFKKAGKFENTRSEKIHNVIFDSSYNASLVVAQEIANLIKKNSKLTRFVY